MTRLMTILAASVLALAVTPSLQAQCDACDSGCVACAAPSCCSAPACQAAGRCCGGPQCVGKAEMVDVEKHCWNIECEEVCVPAVRFPWEHGGNKLTLFTLFDFKCGPTPGCEDGSCDGGRAATPACGCSNGCDGGCGSRSSCGCSGAGCATCVPPKCGFVVTVRDLKKKTYDAQVCEYSIGLSDNENGGGCCDQCTNPGCTGCDVAPYYQQYERTPQMDAPPYETTPVISHPADSQPATGTSQTTTKSKVLGKLKFVSLRSRLFGNTSSK